MVHSTLGKRVAIVTGGGSATGQRVCARLAREGWPVVVWDQRFGAALSVVAQIEQDGGEADAIQVEIMDPEALGRAAALTTSEWGLPALLVNCTPAAASLSGQLAASATCVKALSSILKDAGSGVILNVLDAQWQTDKDLSEIVVSTESTAKQMAPFRIRVNALVGADLNASRPRRPQGTSAEVDVLDLISSLCSQDSDAVSGAVIAVG